MRFVTFDDGLDELVGVLREDRVIPLLDDSGDLVDLITAGDTALDFTRAKLAVSRCKGLPLADVRLLAPLRRLCRDVLCTGWTGDRPEFFTRCADTVIGPYDPKVPAKWERQAELAVVIGRGGRDIPRETALSSVWGYTLASNADATMLVGPWVVTPDELGDPQDLQPRCVIDKETAVDVATLISELSAELALRPGDLVLTGAAPQVLDWDLATPPRGERP